MNTGPIDWRKFSWKWFLGVVGGITAVLLMFVAFKNAHPIIEPLAPALRGYAREVAESSKKTIEPLAKRFENYDAFRIEQTLELAKLSLNTLNGQLDLAKKEAEMYPNSIAAKEAFARVTSELAGTKKRIEGLESALFAARSGGK